MAIRSFATKSLKVFWETGDTRKLPARDHANRQRLILDALDAAEGPSDMNIPGLKLHRYKVGRPGYYSAAVSGNWRIIWKFDGSDAVDVEIWDPHS